MASRIAMNSLRNLPVKTVLASEGNITRSDVFSPNGGKIKDVVSYASPVVKGDLVQLTGSTNKEFAVVGKYSSGLIHGVAVSDPQGIDGVTTSGSAPADAQKRRVDVAFFGLGIVELETTGTQTPGQFYVANGSITGSTTKGGMLVVRYAVSGEKVPVLVGFGAIPAAGNV